MEKEEVSILRIPDDIIFDILKRLPAKSLMRFKCVCKTWLSLIFDPHFAKSHHLHAQTRSGASYLLVRVRKDPQVVIPANLEGKFSSQLPSFIMDESSIIPCTHVVNGLMCCFNQVKHQLFMVNLTTREETALPTPGIQKTPLAYNDRKPSYILGFDPITFKYKLLHLRLDFAEFEILTFGTNSWRKLDWPNFASFGRFICINRFIYFMYLGHRQIQLFDFNEEKFQMLNDLQVVEGIHQHTRIEKNFPLICGRRNPGTWICDVWILNYEDKFWVRERIDLPDQVKFFDCGTLGTMRTGEIFAILIGEFKPWRMIHYDLKTKELRTTEITLHPQICDYPKGIRINNVYYHIENIIPLRRICEGR